MADLILPTADLHAAFLDCRADWGPGLHEDGFGLADDDEVASPAGFAAWVHRRIRLTHPAGLPCPAESHGSPRWIVEDGRILGAIALRHHADDRLGQLGYGIRPSARGRGLASWALAEMLVEARAVLGGDSVLVLCRADNAASARTIERNGGILTATSGPVRRYRIPLHVR